MKRLAAALLCAAALLACSDDDDGPLVVPSPVHRPDLICSDALGVGPDITLVAPYRREFRQLDACRLEDGRCLYNCGRRNRR